MSRPAPIDRLMSGETSLEQKPQGVLVTFRDGSSRLVLNARLTKESVQRILDEAGRPADMIRAGRAR